MLRDELFAMLNRDKLSDYLPYLAYDDGHKVYLNRDNTIGFILELFPIPFAGEAQINAFKTIYELSWSKDTIIQVMLYADPNQESLLNSYKKLREVLPEKDFLKEWSERFCDYLFQHRHKGISKDVPVPFRNYRVFLSIKYKIENVYKVEEEILKLAGLREGVVGSLKAAHIESIDVGADELIYMLKHILNIKSDRNGEVEDDFLKVLEEEYKYKRLWNEEQSISEQIIDASTIIRVDKDCININDWYVKVKTPKIYCNRPTPYKINQLIGDLLSGSNQMQIPCPFMLVLNVNPKDASNHIYSKANIILAQQAATKIAPRLMRKKEEFSRAVNELEEKKKYFWGYLSIVLFSEDKKSLDRASKIVEACWAKQEFELQDEMSMNLPLFLYALPFGPYLEGVRKNKIGRFEPVDTYTLSICTPIQADWFGTGTPVLPFISRRGQIMMIDLRDSETNYNCLIAAQSGAGKSFLTNYIITNYLSIGGMVYVIDVGRSYEKLCKMIGGQYIEFTSGNNISLNIFSLLNEANEKDDGLFIMLVNVLAQMAKPKEKITDYESKILINALKIAIERAKETGSYVSIDLIIDILKEESQILEDKKLQDRRRSDLAEMLEPYSSRGMLGKWFRGPINLDFNNRFVVLELEELNINPDLREVVLLMIMSFIDQKLYFGDRSIPKLIIIDEAWDLLRGANTSSFIETGYRRARKYGGSYITITQSIMDFFREDNAGVGQAIISNSAFKFLLMQKAEDLHRAKKEDKLVLSDFELELAKMVHTVQGKYSEIFIKSDRAYGVGRLFVDKFTQYLYNTSPKIVEYLTRKLSSGYSLTEAIDLAIQENIK